MLAPRPTKLRSQLRFSGGFWNKRIVTFCPCLNHTESILFHRRSNADSMSAMDNRLESVAIVAVFMNSPIAGLVHWLGNAFDVSARERGNSELSYPGEGRVNPG
jgi:hypothetical protein